MVKSKFLLGIPVLVLVFGMSMTGHGQSLNSGAPTAAALAAGGLTQAQFNQIRNAGAGGFQGWQISRGSLLMVWAGRTKANFTAVASVVAGLRGGSRIDDGDNGELFVHNNFYTLVFNTRNVSLPGGGQSPARRLELVIKPW
ncbi:MAG: hypothetical protein FWG92_00070 [Leptospirales bacterium]|nr:hypothetical protein [Leptospirales bacterium]